MNDNLEVTCATIANDFIKSCARLLISISGVDFSLVIGTPCCAGPKMTRYYRSDFIFMFYENQHDVPVIICQYHSFIYNIACKSPLIFLTLKIVASLHTLVCILRLFDFVPCNVCVCATHIDFPYTYVHTYYYCASRERD